MCNGRFFHKWGKWELVSTKMFTNEKYSLVCVKYIQKRTCTTCNKIEFSVSGSESQ